MNVDYYFRMKSLLELGIKSLGDFKVMSNLDQILMKIWKYYLF